MPTYKHPRPCVTVDVVLFWRPNRGPSYDKLRVLMVRRKASPFKHHLALPGGFVRMNEGLEDAARRELKEETGLDVTRLEQLHAFGDPKRDPRSRVISVAYMAEAMEQPVPRAGDDAERAEMLDVPEVRKLPLAFDHASILSMALERLARNDEEEAG